MNNAREDREDQAEEAEERHENEGDTWWAGLGPAGATVLVVLGATAAVWLFFRLPGTPDDRLGIFHGVAKVLAIGLVVAGTTALHRFRTRGARDSAQN